MNWWIAIGSFLVAGACVLLLWRYADIRAERRLSTRLLREAGPAGPTFDAAVLDGLPEVARAYFEFTIAPGTPLVSIVQLEMSGRLGLGSRARPGYMQMRAHQILSPMSGLLWRVRAGAISGSDAFSQETSWTRFWLFGLIPLVHTSGTADHYRSAFGRLVSESAFWMPSSLLPGRQVFWESAGDNVARVTLSRGGLSQSIDLTLEADGRPSSVVFQRWSNANPGKVFQEQPFGGYLSDFRDVGGYRIPMHVEGGNHFGTPEYFPFYIAEVTSVRFPQLTRGGSS